MTKPPELAPVIPRLAICIPTYNRRDRVLALAKSLLGLPGAFELCIHVDGSVDGTHEMLQALSGPRMRVSQSPNQGRAGALLAACDLATAPYIMVFDDDDTLYPEGLARVLEDCAVPPPPGVVGFVYHLEDQNGRRIGTAFPVARANFLALRADHGVRGDKKEVVLASALRRVAFDGRGHFRRTPTSLIWSRLALDAEVLTRNIVIGQKVYLEQGMTANAGRLKTRNAYPMLLLYRAHAAGFLRRRYQSPRFFGRALAGMARYGALSVLAAARTRRGT